MLDQFEFVGETSTDDQLVLAAGIVTTDFHRDQTFVVHIERNTFNETVDLAAFGEDLNLALAVEDSFLSVRAHVVELVLVDEELG